MARIATATTTPDATMATASASKIEALSSTLDVANRVMIGSLIVAALAAVVVAVSTFLVIRWQGRLDRLKDAAFEAYKVEADERTASAGAKAAEANEEAAKANERAAALKLALEKEIAKRDPRRVSDLQKNAILLRLSAAPKGPVVVTWKLFDEEAEQFGKQLVSLLKTAGFEVKEVPGPMSFGVAGQWILVDDPSLTESKPSYAGAIQQAFNSWLGINFQGTVRKDPFPDMGPVIVAIGRKEL